MARRSIRTRARTAVSFAVALPQRLVVVTPTVGRLLLVLALCLAVAVPAGAQSRSTAQALPEQHRSGPRFGVTFLGGSIADSASEVFDQRIARVVTQFGWQYERQFMTVEGGPTGVSEWVLLVGGLEQGVIIPSVSWIVGVRLPNDVEFGVGPNLGAGGAALVLTAGRTYRAGAMNIPVNVAVVPSRIGTRVSLMTGFNLHD